MDYLGLSEKEVAGLKEDGWTDEQIQKRNGRAMRLWDEKLRRFTLKKLDRNDPPKELRLLLLGKTGSGKSSTGNLILGKDVFLENGGTVTHAAEIKEESVVVDGLDIRVIDTPGLCDTSEESLQKMLISMAKVLDRFSDGIHGFLFVMSLANPRFTKEEKAAFEQIEKSFRGKHSFYDHCFIILTHGESIGGKLSLSEKLLQERKTPLGQLLMKNLAQKVIIIENQEGNAYFRDEQRKQIVRLVRSHVSSPYTNDVTRQFLEDQEKLAGKLLSITSAQAQKIESAISKELQHAAHKDVKTLSNEEKGNIVSSVLDELSDALAGIDREELEGAVSDLLEGKI